MYVIFKTSQHSTFGRGRASKMIESMMIMMMTTTTTTKER